MAGCSVPLDVRICEAHPEVVLDIYRAVVNASTAVEFCWMVRDVDFLLRLVSVVYRPILNAQTTGDNCWVVKCVKSIHKVLIFIVLSYLHVGVGGQSAVLIHPRECRQRKKEHFIGCWRGVSMMRCRVCKYQIVQLVKTSALFFFPFILW